MKTARRVRALALASALVLSALGALLDRSTPAAAGDCQVAASAHAPCARHG